MSFFTVIIPTHNRQAFLEKAITSVRKQTFKDFELIIIDDGSSDATRSFVTGIGDPRIIYRYQPHQGVSAARNHGLRLARGPWIAFLDSDDRFTSEKLSRSFTFIQQFPHIKVFHTEELWYRNGELLPQKKKHKKPQGNVYLNMLPICCISTSTIVLHQEVFERVGVFDENLKACEDYDFLLRVTARYEVKLIPEALTVKDGGRPDQLSALPCLDIYRVKALHRILQSGVLTPDQWQMTWQQKIRRMNIIIKGARNRYERSRARHLVV